MSEETFSVENHEESGKCILCGKETNTLCCEGNHSGGSTFFLCNECGRNLFLRLQLDTNFKEIAKQMSW